MILTRTFRAPIGDVWAAVTEPDRLARWIGTWSGDPASGSVRFRMTAEGADAPAQTYEIWGCEPPYRLMVHAAAEAGVWDLGLDLTETGGIVTLEFAQVIHDPTILESVGPGWEYYLDRLVTAETGGDPATIDFDRYYHPALSAHYRGLLSGGR